MQLGVSVAVALWVITALSFTLGALRLYTRIRLVHLFAVEDHLFLWTSIFLLAFTTSIQIAIHYGLGRSFWGLTVDESANAIFWTYVATTLAVTGNSLAKLSMGFFLLRISIDRSYRIVLRVLILITAATAIALPIMLWNQTTPIKASWDVLRTPGTWRYNIQPFSVGLGAWSSACDFFFAVFPWLLFWSLKMPLKDKIILTGGMSLGVIAGACGIVRTVVLSKSTIDDYTLGFAEYFVWAGAEIAVALVCLAIPTLRPLYTRRGGRVTAGYEQTAGHEPRRPAPRTDPESVEFAISEPKRLAAQSSRSGRNPEFHELSGQEVWSQNYHVFTHMQASDHLHTTVESTATSSRATLTMPAPAGIRGQGGPAKIDNTADLNQESSRWLSRDQGFNDPNEVPSSRGQWQGSWSWGV